MEKVAAHTSDLVQANIEAIAELFPNVVTEVLGTEGNVTRAIDFDALRQELSDHVVEGPRERYLLDWPGKRAAMLAANAPTRSTLRPMRDESVNFDSTKNLFIEGDNLEALKILQESYLGKVKLIYIDPPYNTGNDFIYDDDFAESSSEYLERTGQVDDSGAKLVVNTEANGRFHSDWLSMMYPRLKLARSLLSSDGLIAVSIGDRESHNLQRLLDEVFGASNHIATLGWKKRGTGGQVASNAIIKQIEYIHLFARDISRASLTGPQNENVGQEKWRDFRKAGGQWQRRYRPNQYYPFYLTPTGDLTLEETPGSSPIYPRDSNGEEGFWENGFDTARTRLANGEFRAQEGRSGWKVYQLEVAKATMNAGSFIDIPSTRGTEELRRLFGVGVFENPKPTDLLEWLINLADVGPGQIILDFFAGSGTTGHAAWSLARKDSISRRFILVQLDEAVDASSEAGKLGFRSISDLARERLRLVRAELTNRGEMFLDGIDLGFRTLRVDSGSFREILQTPDATNQDALLEVADNIKDDRNDEALLFQVIGDWGLEFSLPIRRTEVDGVEVLDVDNGSLIACFSPTVPISIIRRIAGLNPLRAVFRDSSFATDAERINVEQIFRELSPDAQVRVI